MSYWRASLTIGSTNIVYFIIVIICCSLIDQTAAVCPDHTWWDQKSDSCAGCTICEEQTIVLRPCQIHKDTVCGTLQDLEIDWSFLADAQKRVVAPDWEEVRMYFNITKCTTKYSIHTNLEQIFIVLVIFYCNTKQPIEENNLEQQSATASDIMWLWDWQAASLALAAISCLLFFIVAACIFWQHTRYWKKMERMERGFNAGRHIFFIYLLFH